MDELVKKLQEQVGLSAEQAVGAAQCVKSYIKERVPALVADKLDNIFNGEKVEVGDILREKANDLADNAKDTLHDMADLMDNFAGKATRKTEELYGKLNDFFKHNAD